MTAAVATMPRQKRGKSKQDYCTPRAFLDAVERRFAPNDGIVCDLAANLKTRVCERYLGPDHFIESVRDSLRVNWAGLSGLYWLNPPYANIAPWARKCAESTEKYGSKIAMLVPASVGANWYWDHAAPHSHVLAVGRLKFVVREADGSERPACFDAKGKPTSYPKDLILALYGIGTPGAFERWRWDAGAGWDTRPPISTKT